MTCSACGEMNPEAAKFCMACGAKMELQCNSCGTELTAGAKFCIECGTAVGSSTNKPTNTLPERTNSPAPVTYTPKHLAEKILLTRSVLEGELKQVTVMFVDVKGSMDLAATLGAEIWHTLLDDFFAILGEGIHRYEGTINQYTGDGIMALFGAPIAHEDHAQRACYAAIYIRAQLKAFADRVRIERGVDFSVRTGINSGDVVVGKIGDDLRMDYTAQGHTVGLAQRIEQLAASGRIYLSEYTQRLVSGFFEFSELGSSQIKGVEQPVSIFELEQASDAKTRLDVARQRGLTQFVGRNNEMSALEAALERALAGHGQVVGVVGDPGLGKSRLCYEFVQQCRERGLQIVSGHCPAHGKSIPLIPIFELYRSYFGINAGDSAELARQKIAGSLVLLDPTFQEILPLLFDFLGVADPSIQTPVVDVDARQTQLFAMLRQVYRLRAERGMPAVFFIDDVHWIDPTSDLFLSQIVDAVAENSQILLLLNFRPEYSAEWMRRSHYQQLPLVPLGHEEVLELVVSLLGRNDSVGNLAKRITQWTGGNPFYTEEVINDLVETELLQGTAGNYRLTAAPEDLKVPDNVRSVLAARIDRLVDGAKHLLQAASVVGKEFSLSVLAEIDGLSDDERTASLEAIKSSDFVFEVALFPEVELAFKHPLTHEVAYASLLRTNAMKLHASAAQALEAQARDNLDEQAPLIAQHWDLADDKQRAIKWHRRAAEWSALSDAAAGLSHWKRIKTLVGELPEDQDAQRLGVLAYSRIIGFHWRLGGTGEEIDRDFRSGIAVAQRIGDVTGEAKLNGAYSVYRGVNFGDGADYCTYALAGEKLSMQTDDAALQHAMRCGFVCAAYGLSAQWEKVLDIAFNTPGFFERDELFGAADLGGSPRVLTLYEGSLALAMMGRRSEAQNLLRHIDRDTAIDRFQEIGMFGEYKRSRVAVLYGDFEHALTLARDEYAKFDKVQTNFGRVLANLAMGNALRPLDRTEEALGYLNIALNTFHEHGSGGMFIGAVISLLAETQFDRGAIDEGLQYAEEAVAFCTERTQKWDLQPWLALVRGCILTQDFDRVTNEINRAQQEIATTGAVIFEPPLQELRADLAHARGDTVTSRALYTQASEQYRSFQAIGHADRVSERLATDETE